MEWLSSVGLSTLVGTVLGLVIGIGFANPTLGLVLGLVVGVGFDLWARRRRSAPPAA